MNSFNSHNSPIKYDYPYIDIYELRHKEAREVAQGHTANKWHSQDSNIGSLAPKSMVLISTLYTGKRTGLRLKKGDW